MDNPLKNWIPYKLTEITGRPLCHWLKTFDKRFTEPFFDETIAVCKGMRNNPINSVSDLNFLEQWTENINDVKPTAFIFHTSRCGSTLVSQLLGIDEQNICLAEVPFFDDLLRLPLKNQGWTIDQCERLFTAALKYYAQKRDGNERRLFIKTDSWHIFFYEQIRKVFPDVPFILLYRSPTEVLLSHTKQRGLQAVPGLIEPELFGFEPDNIANQSLDAYTAKVLERYLSRYIEITQKDKHVLLLNYNQGPMAMVQDIATFTSTPISDDIKLKMKERSGYHSKRPDQLFSGEATQHLPVFLKRADELYREVDAFRLAVV